MSTLQQILGATELMALAQGANTALDCAACAPLRKPGWESMPSGFDQRALVRAGTLRHDTDSEPTLDEYHPAGTHGWSPDAPIAPAFHPYNRCDVWTCTTCRRVFLRYTEYGGYYQDERVRPVDPDLVVAT